ncbi:MAG TPA: hypothetical protein VNM70_21605 [Burkholderiales bacterium]|nr:hypothetical protein [Burkholderiales bacterium]
MKEQLPDRDLFGARPHEYVLPPNYRGTTCASCGAYIAFVRTPAGKAMPVALATAEIRDGVTYCLPHWIDCPQSREWSSKK